MCDVYLVSCSLVVEAEPQYCICKVQDKGQGKDRKARVCQNQNPNDVIKMYRTRDSIVRSNF